MTAYYTPSIRKYILILLICWSFLVIGIASWKVWQNGLVTHELATKEARANFNKDQAFRLWGTNHGKIYVPISDSFQPDPNLSHIPERDISTPGGQHLSLINPARIIREMNEKFSHLYGVTVRITNQNPLRLENAPDPWEKKALLKLRQGIEEVIEYTEIDGESYLRLMQPLKTQAGCLLCHPTFIVGENGGGVVVNLPMKSLLAKETQQNKKDITLLSLLWLLGSLALLAAYRSLQHQSREKARAFNALSSSEKRNGAIMMSALDSIITIDSEGCVRDINPATEKTFGYSRSQMIGEELSELIIPHEMRGLHRKGLAHHLHCGESKILGTRIETIALHADGHTFPVELAITRINLEHDVMFTAYLRDIAESKELKRELDYQKSHDALTGLINRSSFEHTLDEIISEGVEMDHHCLLYIDLDQFKVINDISGHNAGDQLLQQIGQLLLTNKRRSDALSRLEGDEFALLLESCPLHKGIEVANKLINLIRDFRFQWNDKTFHISISIGMVPIEGNITDHSELLLIADTVCHSAKEEGRGRLHIYEPDNQEIIRRRSEISWINRIQSALNNDRFLLYKQKIQPIEEEDQPDKIHCEILLRMLDQDDNIILPYQFIPAAERYNLMHTIDKWMVSNTFKWLGEKPEMIKQVSLCSINLSGFSITDPVFSSFIRNELEKYKIPANIICFEVTETVAITNLAKATQFLNELHEVGCLFALDDFGSGVSSYGYLKALPVDFLKIDGEFVKDIATNMINYTMVKSINEIGKVMGKKTIAEYVEDETTVELLKEIGVDYAQGYLFSRPEPVDQ
ncbi:MAG: EAL domain-containing protein [Gammaproteobacteria bacterium]|nr:EAL domain-containing protein [Gammaproteobacteria bacterium]